MIIPVYDVNVSELIAGNDLRVQEFRHVFNRDVFPAEVEFRIQNLI